MSDKGSAPSDMRLGDFPFELSKGRRESPYLTWLRNHSNYMATRGFLDYLRAVGVLLQGILTNSLIVLSLLLVVSVVIGHLYGKGLRERNALAIAAGPVDESQSTDDQVDDDRPIDSVELTAHLWDLEDPTRSAIDLPSGSFPVNAVAISPDDQWVVTASEDSTARLWKLGANGTESREPFILTRHERPILAAAFSPDNHWLATASWDGIALLWNLEHDDPSENPVLLKGHSDWIRAVAFSPDNQWLATGSDDNTVILWKIRQTDPSNNPVKLTGHNGWIRAVAFSLDNQWLATAGDDNTVLLWKVRQTDPSKDPVELKGDNEWIKAVAFSPDNRWLATGSDDNTVRLWKLDEPDPSKDPVELKGQKGGIRAVAFSPPDHPPEHKAKLGAERDTRSEWLAIAGDDATARLWSLNDDPPKNPVVLGGHEGPVSAVAFTRDGETLVTASDDSTVRLWDIEKREQVPLVLQHDSSVLAMAIGSRWLVTGSSSERRTSGESPTQGEPRLFAKLKTSLGHWFKAPRMPSILVMTVCALGLYLLFVLLSPILIFLSEIVGQPKSMKRPGSDSSVRRRDRWERAFGFALLLIFSVAFFEALPALVFKFHKLRASSMNWNAVFTSMTAVSVAVMGGAGKLLSALGGAQKKVAMLLIGLLGLLAPLIVVLYFTEYVVFGPPADSKTWIWLIVFPALGLFGGLLAVVVSLRPGISWWVRLRMFIPPLVVLYALAVVVVLLEVKGWEWSGSYQEEAQQQSPQLIKVAEGLARLTSVDDQTQPANPTSLEGDLAVLAKRFLDHSDEDRLRRAPEFAVELESTLANKDFESIRAIRNRLTESGIQDMSELSALTRRMGSLAQKTKVVFLLIVAIELWLFCWLLVDVNRTSIHGLYRDRLASSYLVGRDTRGDIGIEEDVNLGEICCHEAHSTAPYHLLNVALNLQGSRDSSIRDRHSDFFIFSKRFVGGQRTGYARTATIERVHPQMGVGTAMAISAAAASPNMGRGTHPALVAFMVLLNIRLGYWLPNPGLLEEVLAKNRLRAIRKKRKATRMAPGFTFEEVFQQEMKDIERRRKNVYKRPLQHVDRDTAGHRKLDKDGIPFAPPTTRHELVGLGLSGGGIRSATINLGIVQVLHEHGVFDHVDYMSTVSGGGYLGSSISTLMRERTKTLSDVDGDVSSVEVDQEAGDRVVKITRTKKRECEYPFSGGARLAVKDGGRVIVGQLLGEESGTPVLSEIEGVVSVVEDEDNKTVQVVDEEREYRYSKDATLDEGVVLNRRVKRGDPLIRPSGRTTRSEFAGRVSVEEDKETGEKVVKVTPGRHGVWARLQARFGWGGTGETSEPGKERKYHFSKYDALRVRDGGTVGEGESLIQRHNSLLDRFRWRVKPVALVREMSMRLNETHKWVNLSDGGHIENLAGMELLRRRCKYIIIGDGEADPQLTFNGLATLIRFARLDLGIRIDIDPKSIRVKKNKQAIEDGTENLSTEHWASGKITYPANEGSGEEETGYLLYLKSSYTGDEDEVIKEYRRREPTFPHQSTADQFFDEGQFECYRALGEHIAEKAFERDDDDTTAKWPTKGKMSFSDLRNWFEGLEAKRQRSSTEARGITGDADSRGATL